MTRNVCPLAQQTQRHTTPREERGIKTNTERAHGHEASIVHHSIKVLWGTGKCSCKNCPLVRHRTALGKDAGKSKFPVHCDSKDLFQNTFQEYNQFYEVLKNVSDQIEAMKPPRQRVLNHTARCVVTRNHGRIYYITGHLILAIFPAGKTEQKDDETLEYLQPFYEEDMLSVADLVFSQRTNIKGSPSRGANISNISPAFYYQIRVYCLQDCVCYRLLFVVGVS